MIPENGEVTFTSTHFRHDPVGFYKRNGIGLLQSAKQLEDGLRDHGFLTSVKHRPHAVTVRWEAPAEVAAVSNVRLHDPHGWHRVGR